MIIRQSDEKLTGKQAVEYIEVWESSTEFKRLEKYQSYYDSENEELVKRVADRKKRGKTPNYFVPTPYLKTLTDTMCGYLFQNILYSGDEVITDILTENSADTKDMKSGTIALAYNRAVEYVYTTGDANSLKYKFTPLPTRSVTLIYNGDIEPELFCGIRKYNVGNPDLEYTFDVIYKDLVQTYEVKKDSNTNQIPDLPTLVFEKPLLFDDVPLAVYHTEIITDKSSFSPVIPYIEALDWVITGNTNELDRIVDSLLVLGKYVTDAELQHSDEWKALLDYSTEDRAEYISKEMSPEFREYLSKLLIQEIHKHSHIVDWYSPDAGVGGAASGKALKTRLFDMDMFSKRIEKVYRIGLEQRISLLRQLLNLTGEAGDVEIVFTRTVPSDLEDLLQAMVGVDFLSQETKVEAVGKDWELELERLEAQKERIGVEEPFELEPREPIDA